MTEDERREAHNLADSVADTLHCITMRGTHAYPPLQLNSKLMDAQMLVRRIEALLRSRPPADLASS